MGLRDLTESAVTFYEALGASIVHGSRDGDFVLLRIGAGQLSLLAHPPNPEQNEGTVELNFETGEDLQDIETRLIATPDGLLAKINELQPDLYA